MAVAVVAVAVECGREGEKKVSFFFQKKMTFFVCRFSFQLLWPLSPALSLSRSLSLSLALSKRELTCFHGLLDARPDPRPVGPRLRHVVRVAAQRAAGELADDARAAPPGVLEGLED